MDDINSDFGNTDIAFVLGANDVVNPLAEQPGSAIYGMPILKPTRRALSWSTSGQWQLDTRASTTRSSTWTRR